MSACGVLLTRKILVHVMNLHVQEFRSLSYARIAELRSAVRLRVVQSIEESNKRRYHPRQGMDYNSPNKSLFKCSSAPTW